jgi:hypothetical protein
MKINPITIKDETSFPPKTDLPSAEYFCLLSLILKSQAKYGFDIVKMLRKSNLKPSCHSDPAFAGGRSFSSPVLDASLHLSITARISPCHPEF